MKYFFPGCNIKKGYPEASHQLKQYMKETYQLEAQDCCKISYPLLEDGSTAVLICNNCAHDIKERIQCENIEYVYDLINKDTNFIFPNYNGKKMYLQHCHHGFDDFKIKPVICALLEKMNIDYIELEDEVSSGLDRSSHRQICISNSQIVSQDEVITYCAICNLAYKNEGVHTHYLLDLLFDI